VAFGQFHAAAEEAQPHHCRFLALPCHCDFRGGGVRLDQLPHIGRSLASGRVRAGLSRRRGWRA
jgi:hypothetical protein